MAHAAAQESLGSGSSIPLQRDQTQHNPQRCAPVNRNNAVAAPRRQPDKAARRTQRRTVEPAHRRAAKQSGLGVSSAPMPGMRPREQLLRDHWKEVERLQQRVLFTHDDWTAHRSRRRFQTRLSDLPRSYLARSVAAPVACVTAVAVATTLPERVLPAQWWAVVQTWWDVSDPQAPFSLSSPFVALLLVFRTTYCAARYNEARDMWAELVAAVRNGIRIAMDVFPRTDRNGRGNYARWLCAFAFALKARLQEDAHLDTDLAPIMTPHESRLICNSSDPVRLLLLVAIQGSVYKQHSHCTHAAMTWINITYCMPCKAKQCLLCKAVSSYCCVVVVMPSQRWPAPARNLEDSVWTLAGVTVPRGAATNHSSGRHGPFMEAWYPAHYHTLWYALPLCRCAVVCMRTRAHAAHWNHRWSQCN